MPERGRVYVIDDDEAMRDSLNFLLDSADFSVTLFETAIRFLEALPGLEFGCVVSDVRMPGMDGIELLKRMKAGQSSFPIVIMTGHGDVPLAVEAMKLGAVDFLEKPFEDDRLIGMIEAAIRQAEPAARSEALTHDIAARIATLSPRERQVMDGLIAGLSNKLIARDYDISPRTIEVYRANVMTKMQANSLSELVRFAMRAGLLKDSLTKPTVYVVDDDADVLRSLRFLLETDGFTVRTFSSGVSLLNAVRQTGVDCFVIDYKMPDMNGIDLARRLRNRDIAAPVVLITGYPDENISARAEAAGVRHVLLKPLLEESLVTRIRGAIQDSGPIGG
jgi:two-component system response regulator FixJ